jgi:hypothetical protein
VYHRWYQVITDTSLAPLQPPKWEHIFTIPWIDPPIAVEIADHRDREWQELMTELGLGSP